MAKLILSQSANGRAIDCTSIVPADNNYLEDSNDTSKMIVLLHKPVVPGAGQPFVPEEVSLTLHNPDKKTMFCRVDFNGEGLEYKVKGNAHINVKLTVQGYSSAAVVTIHKDKDVPLLVSGGAEN